jgi:hypothetical protein
MSWHLRHCVAAVAQAVFLDGSPAYAARNMPPSALHTAADLHANGVLLHTGWCVESLATQTLVLFVIRTAGNPLTSRAGWWLALSTLIYRTHHAV